MKKIVNRGYLNDLLRSKKSVFSFKDLLLFWGINAETAKSRVNYYVKTGDLYHLRRGLYAKDKNYDRLEAATKIFTPCYVSFETVLASSGIVFQVYSQIFVASYQTKEVVMDGQKYSFKTMKDTLLLNNAGIENNENYSIASPERAFLDVCYLNVDYHFDNLRPLDWEKVFDVLPAFGENQRLLQSVKKNQKYGS